jgi:uncharacterized membrane protein YdbT with pleckstrin-like domain
MEEQRKPCPACGEMIMATAHKCRFCGTDIDAYVAAREATVEKTLFEGHPAVVYSAGQYVAIVLTLGIALLVYWIRSQSTRFIITTQRVRIERGLFSKMQDNLELFRVDHIDLHKPVGQRMLGYATVHLHSSDAGMASVYLYGIADLEALADTLRDCSLRERSRRRVLPVEQM